jgi:hypothetical protein
MALYDGSTGTGHPGAGVSHKRLDESTHYTCTQLESGNGGFELSFTGFDVILIFNNRRR